MLLVIRFFAALWLILALSTAHADEIPIRGPPSRRPRVSLMAMAPGYFQAAACLTVSDGGAVAGDTEFMLEPVTLLAGIVVDPEGVPVAGVDVERASHFTRSGADGRFRLPARPNAVEVLTAWKPDYVTAQLETAVPRTGSDTPAPEIRIELEHARRGFGQVVDVDRRPVDGAEISLWSSGPSRGLMGDERPDRRTVTDADGRFELSRLEPATVDLWVRAPGTAGATIHGIDLGRGKGPLDFGAIVLEPGVRVEGRTVDEKGRPLPGIEVDVLPWGRSTGRIGRFDDPRYPTLETDLDGRFVLEDRAKGEKLSFRARPEGYARVEVVGLEMPPDEPVTLVLKPAAGVRGQVVDPAGRPVPEASVMVWSRTSRGGGSGRSTPCDPAGSFEYLDAEPGRIRIVARAEGFGSAEQELTVSPGEIVEGLRLVLAPGAALEGWVTTAAGDPVAGASIRVHGLQHTFPLLRPIFSDEDGRFRVDGLEPGPVEVGVRVEGFAPWQRRIEARAGTRTVTIELEIGTPVSGRVVDEALEPVGGAGVGLTSRDGGPSGGHARSGADGTFTIDHVLDGRYGIRAHKEGYAVSVGDGEIEVVGRPIEGVQIRLKRGGAITGSVHGFDPERRPELRLQVRHETGQSKIARVDEAGRYRVDHLQPGEWTVSAEDRASGRGARGRATLEPGVEEVVLDLELLPGATLTGHVRLDGEPLPLTRVSVQGLDVTSRESALTDSSGAFSLPGLPEGRYRIHVTGPFPGRLEHRREIELGGDRDVEIELSALRVRGVVVDADDGEPLAGAGIFLTLGEDASPRREADVKTATDGSFLLEQVAEGRYRLRAQLESYAPAERTIEVGPGAAEEMVIPLEAAAGLELAVRLSRRRDRWVFVAVLGAGDRLVDWGAYGLQDAVETPEGRVRLDRVPAGRWTLVVGAPGHGTVRHEVAVPAGEVVPVALPPASRLEIRVPALDASGMPATVALTDAGGSPFLGFASWGNPEREWPVHDGRAAIDGLPPGTWNVTVTLPDGGSLRGEASTPVEGGEVEMVVE